MDGQSRTKHRGANLELDLSRNWPGMVEMVGTDRDSLCAVMLVGLREACREDEDQGVEIIVNPRCPVADLLESDLNSVGFRHCVQFAVGQFANVVSIPAYI